MSKRSKASNSTTAPVKGAELHNLVFGATGSGKTSSAIIAIAAPVKLEKKKAKQKAQEEKVGYIRVDYSQSEPQVCVTGPDGCFVPADTVKEAIDHLRENGINDFVVTM